MAAREDQEAAMLVLVILSLSFAVTVLGVQLGKLQRRVSRLEARPGKDG